MGVKDTGLRNSVFHGFQRVRQDFESLKIRIMLLESENRRLKEELKNPPREVENQIVSEPKEIISESQPSLSIETLRLLIKEIVSESISEALKQQPTKALDVFSAETVEEHIPEEPITRNKPQPITKRDKLREDLIKSYERNKKDIIKQQIMTEASRGNLTKITLRDIVVSDKKYCSKASFYRYVEELELQGILQYKRKQGKNIIEPLINN